MAKLHRAWSVISRRDSEPVVLRESHGARLVRKGGQVVCECPFACMATAEKCEFSA